ncbi:MAG TPA: hypothetical protein VMU94_09290 [Streptosporangiaceae bacterium]|nr:hypothetical protein [Streptosporangiaceae bacterium]
MTQGENTVSKSPTPQVLLLDGDETTQTPWQDPWAATEEARAELASKRPDLLLADPRGVGHRISQEINRDPEEVSRLRKAREDARRGRTFRRHSDT